jgi:hypothetical protein
MAPSHCRSALPVGWPASKAVLLLCACKRSLNLRGAPDELNNNVPLVKYMTRLLWLRLGQASSSAAAAGSG